MIIPDMPKALEHAPYILICKHDPVKKYHFSYFVKPLNEIIFHLQKDKDWCNDVKVKNELIIELMEIKNALIELYNLEEYEKPTHVLIDERLDY
jgi:hypothetical protein